MEQAQQFIDSFVSIFAEAGLWLLIGFGFAGLLHAFVSKERLTRHLGKPGIGSVLKATLVGVPLPLCSCSVIPAAASLRQGGASKGASAAFAVSTPEIDVPAASLTWALLGPVMAIARIIAAAVSAVTAGVLIDWADKAKPADEPTQPEKTKPDLSLTLAPCCQAPPAPQSPQPTIAQRLIAAARYAFITLPADLVVWLLVGFVVSAAVSAFVPESWLSGSAGTGILAILIAMGVGMLVYVCATGSTPMAAALIAKGLGPGAALAFLLTGPATNPATMAWVLKDLGARALAIYIASIAGVALASGLTLDWLLSESLIPGTMAHAHAATGSALWGAVLMALMTFALVRKSQVWLTRKPTGKSCCATEEAPVKGDCCH